MSSQPMSRYRSQRKATQESPGAVLGPLPVQQYTQTLDDTIGKSKSRYRRKGPISPPGTATASANAPDQSQSVVASKSQNGPPPGSQQLSGAQSVVRPQGQRKTSATRGDDEQNRVPQAHLGAQDAPAVRSGDVDSHAQEGKERQLHDGYGSQRNQNPISAPAPQPRTQGRPVLVDGPPSSHQITATRSMSALPKLAMSDNEDETAGCLGLFKRKRGEAVPQMEKLPIARASRGSESRSVQPGGGAVVPSTDAPLSAVNSGDRRVLVECGNSKRLFVVTPDTTAMEIVRSAASCMTDRIDPQSAVLLEHFATVGVQRPVRQYERVRDVMNSWDTDRQNSLILLDPGTGSSELELTTAGAPKVKPGEDQWLLSCSQQVGKWDKRLVIMKSDGQITMQKPNKPEDHVNVCHLSDFDIYTPTAEKARKKIKPPKKICFAIKSQQKTSMFESTQNFVHFFCTNDRLAADAFYAAVQEWRSWYLVNVLGAGKKPQPLEKQSAEGFGSGKDELSRTHKFGNSYDSGYQLGSVKPLNERDDFDRRPRTSSSREAAPPASGGFTKSSNQFDTTISPERRTSTAKRKQHPPNSLNNRAQLADDEPLINLGRRPSVDKRGTSTDQTKASPEEFVASGLLGSTYSQRKREYDERENPRTNAFATGADEQLLRRPSTSGPKRTHSTRAQHVHKTTGSGELQRTNSRAKQPPKPLVDLTPQYRDPPQHAKKGRAFNPDSVGPGGLIENATSPEDPLGVPPSVETRNRDVKGLPNRTNSLSRGKPAAQSVPRPQTSRAPEAAAPFTGEGLLAGSQAQQGWGGSEQGRGVADGSHANGPLVDLSEMRTFVPGSLLNKVERGQSTGGPVVDRSREE